MGFWNGLIKLSQGKPVFENETGSIPTKATDENKDYVQAEPRSNGGAKIIPKISIKNCKSHRSGDKVDVTAWITNISDRQIELDKIIIMGQQAQLDRFLSAGEGHEMHIYRGDVQRDDHHHKAQFFYRQVESGDYFQADYQIEYSHPSDGTFEIEELHPMYPIKDI